MDSDFFRQPKALGILLAAGDPFPVICCIAVDFSSLPLIRTKLHRPSAMNGVVSRGHLLERLERGMGCPLSLICAPAGYGKSTLASEWLGNCGVASAWLSLEEEDNDLLCAMGEDGEERASASVQAVEQLAMILAEHNRRDFSGSLRVAAVLRSAR